MGLKRRKPLKENKKKRILLRTSGICEREGCDCEINEGNHEIHHILPVEFGGDNSEDNLVVLCKRCHNEISQHYQRIIVSIGRYENFIIRNPELEFWRKRKVEMMILSLKHELEKKYNFKNRKV